MQLAPSLHRIGSDLVNSYLVADASGVTVIDAGMPGHWDEFVSELSLMGRTLEDVRALLLTHGDTDHIGYAERLRTETGVPVYVHEGDEARARGEEKTRPSWGKIKLGPLMRFLWYGVRRGGMRTTHLSEVVPLHGGETLDLPGGPRVIHIPGHSPGSVAFHLAAVDAVFVGDAMTTGHVLTGAQGPQPAPFTDDPDQALTSLGQLEGVGAKWVLPGHGAPWSGGVKAAIRRVREVAAQLA